MEISPLTPERALASKIRELALIYGIFGEQQVEYLNRVREWLSYATFCNNAPADGLLSGPPIFGQHRRLATNEIRAIYNSPRVGLCLSDLEGAMPASMEYRLCVLPVICTGSIGRRDYYFDPSWTTHVPPDSDAVAEVLGSIIIDESDHEFIRSGVLNRVKEERRRFISHINTIKNDVERGRGLITLSSTMRYRNGLTEMQSINFFQSLYQINPD